MKKKKSYYSKLVITMVFTILALTIASTGIIFAIYRKAILEEIQLSNQNIVSQISYGKDYMDEQAERIGNSVLTNNYILAAMTRKNYDAIVFQNAIEELKKIVIANSNIDSIYIYNPIIKTISSSNWGGVLNLNSFYDQEAIQLLEDAKTKENQVYARNVTTNFVKKSLYTYVYYLNNVNNAEEKCAVVVNLKVDYLTELIQNLSNRSSYKPEALLVLNQDGIVINSATNDDFLQDISEKPQIKKIMNNKELSGTLKGANGQTKQVWTYSKNKENSWIFISVVSEKEAFQKVRTITAGFACVEIILLVITFAIAYYIAKRLYQPITELSTHINQNSKSYCIDGENELDVVAKTFDAVMESTRSLEKSHRENRFELKNTYTKNIFLGSLDLYNSQVQEKGQKFGISPNFLLSELKVFMTASIDDMETFIDQFSSEERDLHYFAIINVGTEVIAETFENVGCIMKPGKCTFLLSVNDEQSYLEDAKRLAVKLQDYISEIFKINISISIGNVFSIKEDIREAYISVEELEEYSFLYDGKSILDATYLEKVDNEYYVVDWKQEKNLLEALKMGDIEKALKIYDIISNETSSHSYENIINTYMYLSYTIYNECCLNIEREKSSIGEMMMPMIRSISKMRSKKAIDQAFEKLFLEIIESYKEVNSKKTGDIVEQVYAIIAEEYQNPNICLNMIAEKIHKAPSYVGRVFKERTNKAVSEQIMDTRMAEIKRLLDETDLPLSTIVETVGMEKTNYFYTLFRKYFGVTISAYDRSKKEGEK